MKIVCDSCGAKYSIADEKVAGRVFKIRCKKCGAAIVVRGDQSTQEAAASGAAPAAGFDYGGEAVWHVVVEGEQQGPFSPAQLGGMISANTIGWDAYVWREGFEDWKPAQDIEELVQAIMNPGAGAGGSAEQASHDADPFAEPAAAAPAASAPAAAKADAGADLFAQSDAASPFGGGANPFGGGGDDEDVVASSPSPRVSASQAMTGARNENSVLFSLSNLQALATGGSASGGSASGGGSSSASASKSSPAPRGGMAAGEGSGLIDIRALASATGVSGGPAPSLSFGGPSSSPARVDDLLSIGTAAPGLGSALGAPVIIPEKKESSGGRGMMIGAGVLVVAMMCATGVFAVVMMNNQPDPATAIAAVPVGATGALAPGAAAAATPGADGTPTTTGAAPAAGTADTAAAEPAATGTAGAAAAAEAEEEADGDEDSARSGRRRGSRGGRSSATPAPSASEGASGGSASAASSGSSARRGGGGGGGGDIDDLLGRALAGGSGGGGGGGGGSAPAEDLPEQPARAAVISALNGVQGAVSACGQGQHGMATVAITVAGSTGRVSGANVTGQFAGTPVGSCVARAVRGARFPRFSRATFVINYPFRI